MAEQNQFDKKPERLVTEEITFDAIMNNPILRPISDVDNRISDLDEMVYKKGKDIEKDRAWITEVISDIGEYSTSNFVSRMIKSNNDMSDVIKLLMLEVSSLRGAIKEINNIVISKYGVKVDEEPIEVIKTTLPVTPKIKHKEEFDYLQYLKTIIELGGTESEIAKIIKERIENDSTPELIKDKFERIVINYYKEEEDKTKKTIIGEILALKIKQQEVKK